MRASFLGRESLGPDEVSPTIPGDSPRIPINRQGPGEADADRLLAKIGRRRVTDGRHDFVIGPATKLKPHWVVLGPAPTRETHELWKQPDGTIVRHSTAARKALSKKQGWTYVGPESRPAHEGDAEVTREMREHYEVQLDHQSRDANAPRRRVGRRLADGEVVRTFDGDDTPIAVPHDQRHDTIDKLDPRGKP